METDARAEALGAHPTDNTAVESIGDSRVDGTGDSRVDEQLRVLETLTGRPVAAHVEVFETVHRSLSDIMSAIDSDEGGSGMDETVDSPQSSPATR